MDFRSLIGPAVASAVTIYALCTVDPVPERKPLHYLGGAVVFWLTYTRRVPLPI